MAMNIDIEEYSGLYSTPWWPQLEADYDQNRLQGAAAVGVPAVQVYLYGYLWYDSWIR